MILENKHGGMIIRGAHVKLADGRFGEVVAGPSDAHEAASPDEKAYAVRLYGQEENDAFPRFAREEMEQITAEEFKLLRDQRS